MLIFPDGLGSLNTGGQVSTYRSIMTGGFKKIILFAIVGKQKVNFEQHDTIDPLHLSETQVSNCGASVRIYL